jgi:hypothetical protein
VADAARGRWSDGVVRGTATLRRGGEVLARAPLSRDLRATVPPGCATYALVVEARRPWARLSTTIRSASTFRSCHTEERAPLSLTAVRFAPDGLDRFNRAAPGGTTRIPIWVEQYGDAPIESLTVEASYDGGTTWHEVEVERRGDDWVASVDDPDSGDVALRAVAVDADGNAVRQVVTPAYTVGP